MKQRPESILLVFFPLEPSLPAFFRENTLQIHDLGNPLNNSVSAANQTHRGSFGIA